MKKRKERVIILFLYILITFVFTYNSIKGNLTYADALVNGFPIGDPQITIYYMAWANHAILTDPTQLFHDTTFYPIKYSYLHGEHLFGLSLMSLPIYAFTRNPILGHNIVFLLTFILSAFGVYCLARYYKCNIYAAFIAGIIFAFSSMRMMQASHLHILSAQWLPFTVLYFHKLFNHPNYKNAILLSIFFSLQVLSSWNIAVMLLIVIAFLLSYTLLTKKILNPKEIKFFFLFVLISLIILSPFLYFTFKIGTINQFQFPKEAAVELSAKITTYFVPPFFTFFGAHFNKFFSRFFNILNIDGERTTFFGYTSILILFFSILIFKKMSIKKKHVLFFYYALGGIGLLLSLGPLLHLPYTDVYKLNIKLPLYFLKDILIFKPIRAVARFSIIPFFSLSIIAAMTLDKVIYHIKKVRWKFVLVSILTISILFEHYTSISQDIRNFEPLEVYLWLKEQPENVTILELPISELQFIGWDLTQQAYMLYNTVHWKRMVNGIHTVYPIGYHEQFELLKTFPSDESLERIKELNITYVVFHKSIPIHGWEKIDREKETLLRTNKNIRILKEFDNAYIFSVL